MGGNFPPESKVDSLPWLLYKSFFYEFKESYDGELQYSSKNLTVDSYVSKNLTVERYSSKNLMVESIVGHNFR